MTMIINSMRIDEEVLVEDEEESEDYCSDEFKWGDVSISTVTRILIFKWMSVSLGVVSFPLATVAPILYFCYIVLKFYIFDI